MQKEKKKVGLFSCGGASAVACKFAIQEDPSVKLYYTKCGGEHPDGLRFLLQCQDWFGKEIKIISSAYKDHFDVMERYGFMTKRCRIELKVRPRQKLEYESKITEYFLGFTIDEADRLNRFKEKNPDVICRSPLIEKNLTKENCHCIIKNAGIELPEMYKLGFQNNNCIGCPEGGMGYWSRIREVFPEQFNRMAALERKLKYKICKEFYLDEMPMDAGFKPKMIEPQCSMFCSVI